MSQAWRLDLGDGLRRLSAGGLTAREWIGALMARIEHCDHLIKAWVALDRAAVDPSQEPFVPKVKDGRDGPQD